MVTNEEGANKKVSDVSDVRTGEEDGLITDDNRHNQGVRTQKVFPSEYFFPLGKPRMENRLS